MRFLCTLHLNTGAECENTVTEELENGTREHIAYAYTYLHVNGMCAKWSVHIILETAK